MKQSTATPIPAWVYAIVLLGLLLTLVGGGISKFDPSLLANSHTVPAALRIYTDYMFSRSLAIAILLVVLLVVRARRSLALMLTLLGIIQIIDVCDDILRKDYMLIPGIVVLAVLLIAASCRLLNRPVWSPSAWRE